MKEIGDPLRINTSNNKNSQHDGEQQRLLGQESNTNISAIPSAANKVTLEEVLSAIDNISNGNI